MSLESYNGKPVLHVEQKPENWASLSGDEQELLANTWMFPVLLTLREICVYDRVETDTKILFIRTLIEGEE